MWKMADLQVPIPLGFQHFMSGNSILNLETKMQTLLIVTCCDIFLPNPSALGPWHRVIAYDACVRLCLHAWARGCMEAPMFLENECALLRDAFRQVLFSLSVDVFSKSFIFFPVV